MYIIRNNARTSKRISHNAGAENSESVGDDKSRAADEWSRQMKYAKASLDTYLSFPPRSGLAGACSLSRRVHRRFVCIVNHATPGTTAQIEYLMSRAAERAQWGAYLAANIALSPSGTLQFKRETARTWRTRRAVREKEMERW